MATGRRVHMGRLSTSVPGLRRLEGLVTALAALTGRDPALLASRIGFLDACHAVDAMRPGVTGIPDLVPVKEGRRISGHAPSGERDAILIARGACLRRTMDVTVHGGFSGEPCRRSGIRIRRKRPWHGEAVTAGRLEVAASILLDAWAVRFVACPPGGTFHSALVMPYLGGFCSMAPSRLVSAMVALDGEVGRVVLLSVDPSLLHSSKAGEAGIPGLLAAVEEAVARDEPVQHRYGFWLQDSHEEFMGATLATARDMPDEVFPKSDGDGAGNRTPFAYRTMRLLSLGMKAAMANFRKSLPQAIRDHSGMTGREFQDPGTAWRFFAARAGWEGWHYERANQAMRTVPWIRHFLMKPEVKRPILAGEPLESAVRAVYGGDVPLHPKVLRSLSSTWRRIHKTLNRETMDLRRSAVALDAIFKANPHQRPFSEREVQRMLDGFDRLKNVLPATGGGLASIALAHRDGRGVLRHGPRGLADLHDWIIRECTFLLQATPMPDCLRTAQGLAIEILYPPGRTVKALHSLDATWHGAINANLAARQALLATAKTRPPGGAPHPALYPHVTDVAVTIGDVAMTPLRDQFSLHREGAEMHHCVGSYAQRSMAGTSMILSLRSPGGRSTAELRLREFGEGAPVTVETVQHRSHSNAEPPPKHEESLRILIEQCLPDDLERLAARVAEARALTKTLAATIHADLDIADLDALRDLAYEHLKPYLPSASRRLGRAEWVASVTGVPVAMAA